MLELRNKFAEEKLNMLRELEKSRSDRDKISMDIQRMNYEQESAAKKITEKTETPVQEKQTEQEENQQ
jgi:hypothetical protein